MLHLAVIPLEAALEVLPREASLNGVSYICSCISKRKLHGAFQSYQKVGRFFITKQEGLCKLNGKDDAQFNCTLQGQQLRKVQQGKILE